MTEFKVSVEDYSSPTSQAAKVQIKGVREGILVSLGGGSWEELNKALLDQLDQHANSCAERGLPWMWATMS